MTDRVEATAVEVDGGGAGRGGAGARRPSTRSAPPPRCCAASPSGRRSSRSAIPDRRQWLKAESLQPIGAFKLRGAYVAASALAPEASRPAALITYSPVATTPRASPAPRASSAFRP